MVSGQLAALGTMLKEFCTNFKGTKGEVLQGNPTARDRMCFNSREPSDSSKSQHYAYKRVELFEHWRMLMYEVGTVQPSDLADLKRQKLVSD